MAKLYVTTAWIVICAESPMTCTHSHYFSFCNFDADFQVELKAEKLVAWQQIRRIVSQGIEFLASCISVSSEVWVGFINR